MLDGIPVVDFTAPTLLGIAILLLLLGRIVPVSFLRDKDAEAERWRLAYEDEKTARKIAEAQSKELLESAKTTHSLLTALFQSLEKLKQSGETDAVTKST